MHGIKTYTKLSIICILAAAIIINIPPYIYADQVDSMNEIRDKLSDITEEEQAVLENLFALVQSIEELEREQEQVNLEIKEVENEIARLESSILSLQDQYDSQRNKLREFLQIYQRRGAGSFIEILLNSEDISDFLIRLNIIRDLSRNTDELLTNLDTDREKLINEQDQLNIKNILLKQKQQQLYASIQDKNKLKSDMEVYLASLAEQREYYEEQLNNLQAVWNASKDMFAHIANEISNILKVANLPPDAIKISFSFFSITGIIEDDVLNEMISNYPNIPSMTISFFKDIVEIEFPEHYLLLFGYFEILNESSLIFVANSGSFYGLPLEQAGIDELMNRGKLEFDLSPILGQNKIKSVEIKDGSIELTILPFIY